MTHKILYTEQQIHEGVTKLAQNISKQFLSNQQVVVCGILNGAYMFMSDFTKELLINCEIDFVSVSSYDATSKGNLIIKKLPSLNYTDKHVILLDDICDSGDTLEYISKLLLSMGAASVTKVALVKRYSYQYQDVSYIFELTDDTFIYGYGMDLNQTCRNLTTINKL